MRKSTLLLLSLGFVACGVPTDDGDGALTDEVGRAAAALSTVTYTPNRDTWAQRTLAGGHVDWGTSRELRTNNVDVAARPQRILLGFPVDLAAVCPTFVSATLTMTPAQLTGGLTIYAHPISSAWTPGLTGQLPGSQECEAYSGDSSQFALPNFLPPSASANVTDPCVPVNFNVTAIVSAWCGGSPNRGILLAGHNPDGANMDINFFSMEASAARQPKLTITY